MALLVAMDPIITFLMADIMVIIVLHMVVMALKMTPMEQVARIHHLLNWSKDKGKIDMLLKVSLTEALKTSLPKKTNRKKAKWITDDILNKMDEREAVKGRNEECYQQLNKEISNDCRVAKENWLNKQCREVEDLERQFRTKGMHQKIKKNDKQKQDKHKYGVYQRQKW